MQDNLMQAAMQPYLKLVQANMDLIAKFSTAPEVAAQAASAVQNMLQQGQQPAAGIVQSNAFAQLAQGMLKNYTEFLTEVSRSGMTLLAQGQAEMTRQVQEASQRAIGGATATSAQGAR